MEVFSLDEVKRHATLESAWIAVAGNVYDITEFIRTHPGMNGAGGATSTIVAIMHAIGSDCTEDFTSIHSRIAWQRLSEYCIGQLEPARCRSLLFSCASCCSALACFHRVEIFRDNVRSGTSIRTVFMCKIPLVPTEVEAVHS